MSATKDENHLNPLWWHATCPGMWVLLWITRRVIRSPHWSTWACSPPDGGMGDSSQPRGIFRESPFLAEHSHSVIYVTKWCLQAENATNNYTLWAGKMQRLSLDFPLPLFFPFFSPFPPFGFYHIPAYPLPSFAEIFPATCFFTSRAVKAAKWKQLWILPSFFFSKYKVREAYTYIRSLNR